MSRKKEITSEIYHLRNKYLGASNEERRMLAKQAAVLKEEMGKLCHVCEDKPIAYNEYYCSPECNDKYWPVMKVKRSVPYMQQRLLEMKKQSHIKK